jgi:DNA-binding response OmpR family regulator
MSQKLTLVVDDEVNIVELARMFLEREVYKVSSTGDGLSALDEIKNSKPGLVVLDLIANLL